MELNFKIFWGLPVVLILLFTACEKEFESYDKAYNGGLTFSTDTVSFDTLFTSKGSITKRFKVFNNHSEPLQVQSIALGSGESPYTITVNGVVGKSFENQLIFAKDSMMVLVEVEIDPEDEDLPFLVHDSVTFITNGVSQFVQLEAWGQDAHYIGNVVLGCDEVWTNDRPYVLYDDVLVGSLCHLTIEAGTKVYCGYNTEIYVQGTMQVTGEPDDRVVFLNERQDGSYATATGQWGGIYFLEGSADNILSYATIKNSSLGIRVGSPDDDNIPDVYLLNTIIENISDIGLLAFTSDIYLENTLVANCKNASVALFAGGNVFAYHSTIVGYSIDFYRDGPALYVSDYVDLDDGSSLSESFDLDIRNCIIYGDRDDEIILDGTGGTNSTALIYNNLIKTSDDSYDEQNTINQSPSFVSPGLADFHLDTLSAAKDAGVDLGIAFDLEHIARDEMPDLGAYERVE